MTTLTNIPYHELTVGQAASFSRTLTEKDLYLFAAVSGDINPLHLDDGFARSTLFGERIAHGMWSGALISAGLATRLPGPGTIYLSQDLQFRKPVRLGDTLTVTLAIKEKLPKNRVVLDSTVVNQKGETVVTGTATVIAPSEKQSVEAPELPDIKVGHV